MKKFNLFMSVLIVVTIIFFGVGIIKKVNYNAAQGDSVSVSYTVIDGEDSYPNQTENLVIGESTSSIISDDQVLGKKYGSKLNFDKKLTDDLTIDAKTIKKGSEVKIEAKILEITPKQETNDDSESK